MPAEVLDTSDLASWYARQHLRTDPGIVAVRYLPANSPEREIRLIEINEMIVERERDPLEPIDFGVDVGEASSHKLMVLDVTPAQWEKIRSAELDLPEGWSLDGAILFHRS